MPETGTTAPSKKPPPPFPLSVLTGFLGAGKTSLLNRLLANPACAQTLVLINEFGEIGLDHLLVESVEADMVVLSSGCLCCTIRGDLIATLEDLLRRSDNGRIVPFSRVILETTGLADPAPILHTILTHPYLALRFRLDGVLTVVDAVNGMATLDRHQEAVKQAAMADRLVLSKADIAEAAMLAPLRMRLAELNPGAVLLDAARGEVTAENLLDIGMYDPDRKIPDVRRWLNAEAFSSGSDHGHPHDDDPGDGHAHRLGPAENPDINRHDAGIRAVCLRDVTPLSPQALALFLELLSSAHGASLLRVKGIVALSDDPSRPLLIQGAQHVFHPPRRLDVWPDADRTTRIVFILKDLDESFVRGLWGAVSGKPAPDRPDAAALTANPLAPGRTGLLDHDDFGSRRPKVMKRDRFL